MFQSLHFNRGLRAASVLVAALFLSFSIAPTPARAEAPEVLRYIVGSKPGGGYDRYGRLVAKHLETHLPQTRIIVENRGSGGGRVALSSLAKAGPDEAALLIFNTGLLLAELSGQLQSDMQLSDFNWIGKASSEPRILLVSTETGIDSFDGLREGGEGLIFVTADFGSASHMQTAMLNRAFDLGLRIVPGFGGSEAEAALIKGEVGGLLVSESNVPELMEAGIATPLVAFGTPLLDDLRDLPQGTELASTADETLTAQLITNMTVLGRITVAPPAMESDLLDTLRTAYAATLADPAFLSEAQTLGLPIDFLPGAEVQEIADAMLKGDPRIRALATEAIGD